MKDKIRVLHIVGAMYPGGIENFIMNLYEKIDQNQIQFDFAVHLIKENDYTKRIEEMGGRVYEIPRLTRNPIKSLRMLYHIIKENQYKIVVRHTANALIMPQLLMAKLAGARTICHSHSEKDPQVLLHKIGRIFLSFVSDKRLACSQNAGKWMYGRSSFQVIHNAINLERFSYSEEKAEKIRAEYGIQGQKVYGHIGNLVECKNHLFLMEVFAEIAKRDDKAVFFCIGEGEYREKIEEKIRQLDLSDRVILTGIRYDVENFMSCMDVLLFPSVFEGLPLTLIEAQISGLPSIISDSITKDVIITEGLVQRESIGKHPKEWANQAISLGQKDTKEHRKCQLENIQKAGYDMGHLAIWYQNYFREICP